MRIVAEEWHTEREIVLEVDSLEDVEKGQDIMVGDKIYTITDIIEVIH